MLAAAVIALVVGLVVGLRGKAKKRLEIALDAGAVCALVDSL